MKSKFDDAMSFDPLYEAEKLTGKSYKEDKGTESLGFLMALEHNEKKRDMLKAMNDTYMCIPYPKAIDIILGSLLDFKVVLRKAFMGRSFSKEDKPHEEEFCILWSPSRGIVIYLESFSYGDGTVSTNTISANFMPYFDLPEASLEEQQKYWDAISELTSHSSGGYVFSEERSKQWRETPKEQPLPPWRFYRESHMDGREGIITKLMNIDMHPLVNFSKDWDGLVDSRSKGLPVRMSFVNWGERDDAGWQEYENRTIKVVEECDPEFKGWFFKNILGEKA